MPPPVPSPGPAPAGSSSGIPAPEPTPAPAPSESFDVVPDAKAAALSRQEADNARRYAAERARHEAEAAEREAFRKRQEAAAALFEQPMAPTPTPLPGEQVPPTDSGRWGPAPTPTPLPLPSAPASQLPGAAEAKRFAPRPATQHAAPRPGDLVCGSCGSGNDPARKFCRQCGSSLVAAVVEPTLPWWKRFFARSKKKVPPPRATGPGHPSKRTQRKRNVRKVLGWVRMGAALVAVAGVLGIAAVPALRTKVTDFTSCKSRQVRAVIKPPLKSIALTSKAVASAELPDHPAVKAFDTNIATFWQAPPDPSSGAGSTLTVDLAGPSTVRQIHFFPGLPKDKAPNSQPTPKNVTMTFLSREGDKDVSKQERFTLNSNVAEEDQLLKLKKAKKHVVKVQIAIVDVLPNQGGNQVAITDVQLFGSPAAAPGEKCQVG